jgi:hypothetical protein
VTVHDVICVVDETRRDLEVARAAVAGRFTHNGVALELGPTPDWIRGGLAGDVEWRTEWVKHNEGLDLAHAFATTRDDAFVAAWLRLVDSYCRQVPVGHERSEVAARRIQNWLYTWQRFRHAGAELDPVCCAGLVARLRADVAHLAEHLTPERNHRTLELYALLLAGLALDERALATAALDDLAANAEQDVLADGVHRERSSDYHMIVLRSLVGAVANARAARLAVPDRLLQRSAVACDVALHLQRPDGTTPALSDGDVGDFRPLLRRADALLGRPDLLWAATAGTAGAPPAARVATFPIGGYCTLRSGWGDRGRRYEAERWGVFDCGPIGDGGHGHYDQLAVELWAEGHPLVLDAGRFTYADGGDGWRHWFKGTAAHNTVVVDGLDQVEYRSGKPRAPLPTATFVRHVADGGVDVVVGSSTSPRHDARHTRAVALVGGHHWVVQDRLRGERVHRYQARWHLAPGAVDDVVVRSAGDDHVVDAPGVRLTVPARCGRVDVEEGWISPVYGVKHAAPVVVVTTTGRDADIVTRLEARS